MATNCVSVHRIYIALEPSLDGKEPTAFQAVVLSSCVNTIYMSGAAEQYRQRLLAEAQKFGAAVLRKPFAAVQLLKLIGFFSGQASKIRSSSSYERLDNQGKLGWKEAF